MTSLKDIFTAIASVKQRVAVAIATPGTVVTPADLDALLAAVNEIYPATSVAAPTPAPTPAPTQAPTAPPHVETEAERNDRLLAEVDAANHMATPDIFRR